MTGRPVRGDSGYFENNSPSEEEEGEEEEEEEEEGSGANVASSSNQASSSHSPINLDTVPAADNLGRCSSRASTEYAFSDLDEEARCQIDNLDKQQSAEIVLDDSEEEPTSSWRSNDVAYPPIPIPSTPYPRKRKLSNNSSPTRNRPFVDPIQFETPKPAPTHTPKNNESEAPIIVAHSNMHQDYFDKWFKWGVQWEIARLVSTGKISYDDIRIDHLKELQGLSNAKAAPKVEELLCRTGNGSPNDRAAYQIEFQKELAAKSPWEELDYEEELLKCDPLGCIGCQTAHDDYYGGKIAFTLKLRDNNSANGRHYSLELCEAELSTSTRFTRRYGSWRILRVQIPDSILRRRNNELISYFKHNFMIHKRVFKAFYAKEHSVFLLQLDGNMLKLPNVSNNSDLFDIFLQWHNPMWLNQEQSLAKWSARMALGLSNSVPGLLIDRDEIFHIDDLYSPAGKLAKNNGQKPESKDIMTDGAGFCTKSVLLHLKRKFKWETVPSAIQFRIFGSKGLLLLHPDDDNGRPDGPFQVWIRPSQRKILYDDSSPVEKTHRIVEILRHSQVKTPSRLSTEIIVNLAHNAVPYEVFRDLMRLGLDEIAASLTQWSGPYAMENLWAVIANTNGSVIRSRLGREAGGSSRVMGFESYDREDDDDSTDGEDEVVLKFVKSRSTPWWGDEISGCPSGLEETAMVLLDSGFQPQSCAYLAFVLKEIFKKALNSYIDKYKIMVPKSAEAWIVPDPLDVLAEGEIFLKTSELITGSDGLLTDHLLGDVLITRHPCRLPSDVQKVKAVWKDELRKYNDVIILSVKGERSLASMLGGGDYDGDTGHLIWDPNIVNNFKPSDSKYADPPEGLDDAFEKDTVTVKDFLREGKASSSQKGKIDLMDYLLSALRDPSLVGRYSNLHDVAVYKLGYEDPEAWRLAYMFCAVLDSSKTGKRVKVNILKHDMQRYNGGKLEWKGSRTSNTENGPPVNDPPRREVTLVEFIMDQLKKDGTRQYNHHMSEFEKFLRMSRSKSKTSLGVEFSGLYTDPALEAPWLWEKEKAKILSAQGYKQLEIELEKISTHVDYVRERRGDLFNNNHTSPHKKKNMFTERPIGERQSILREVSFLFHRKPDPKEFLLLNEEEILRLKASYAYERDTREHEKKYTQDENNFSRFPFEVAMRELGAIKAKSLGHYRVITSSFHNVFKVTGSIQSFRKQDGTPYSYCV